MPDHVMNYVESDAPAELTLRQWRRTRVSPSRRRRPRLRIFVPTPIRPAFGV